MITRAERERWRLNGRAYAPPDLTVLRALDAADALREAMKRLRAEVSSLHIMVIREQLGNTNAAVLSLRCDEADATLACYDAAVEVKA